MSLSIDDLAKVEDMSSTLEEWGLLSAYEHLLQMVAARRVAIPESHLFEFAAREFERYGKRRKGGMVNLEHEKRVATYRQRQISRRIHDTARELRFDALRKEEENQKKETFKDVENFLMQGVSTVEDDGVKQVHTKHELQQPEQELEQEDYMEEKTNGDQASTPDILLQRDSVTERLQVTKVEKTTENRNDLNDLTVFAPLLVNLIFKSLDQRQEKQEEKQEDEQENEDAQEDEHEDEQRRPEQHEQKPETETQQGVDGDSSDLSDGSDLSLLSESPVLDSFDTEVEITDSMSRVVETEASVVVGDESSIGQTGLLSVTLGADESE